MFSIIISLPKLEDGHKLSTAFQRNGYEIDAVYNNASAVLSLVNELDEGIVICGYRLPDMHYAELRDCLPKNFQLLLLASPQKISECDTTGIMCLAFPLKMRELFDTIDLMMYQYRQQKKKEKKKERNDKDKEIILKAKLLLMERNHMVEEEAYRYIQKMSMDSGNSMLETAKMILVVIET